MYNLFECFIQAENYLEFYLLNSGINSSLSVINLNIKFTSLLLYFYVKINISKLTTHQDSLKTLIKYASITVKLYCQ